MKKKEQNAILSGVEKTSLDDKNERPWVHTAQHATERDQIGVLWGRQTKRGRVVLVGEIETDDGPLAVIGLPFITRRFMTGVTLCLAREFREDGSSVRSDGEVVKNDPANRRRKKKDA